eukprot:8355272-Karenia_brevis.AAC.1
MKYEFTDWLSVLHDNVLVMAFLWCKLVVWQVGYRGVRVGEATHPGPVSILIFIGVLTLVVIWLIRARVRCDANHDGCN